MGSTLPVVVRRLALLALLAATVPVSAQDLCAEVTELNHVYFGFEQAEVDGDPSQERLEENVSYALGACPDLGVLLTGWADEDEASPDALSMVRAAAVAEWYLAHGVDPSRIGVRAGGEDPLSSAIEDPGPGDSRARRVDSEPVLTADLPPDALDWRRQLAARHDPAPIAVEVADDITLALDWALGDGADCPELRDADAELVLAAATLTVGGRDLALDTACRGTAWPANALLGRRVAQVAPGVYAVDGALRHGGTERVGAGWVVGPRGSRQTDGQTCARYDGLQAELSLGLEALARAQRDGQSTDGTHEILGAALSDLAPILALVARVGGPSGSIHLDCTPLHPSHDH